MSMTTPNAPSLNNFGSEFERLVEVVRRLRAPDGCPWDKEQTQSSLTQYVIEETYELVDAIDSKNQKHIQEELGDFLFQVILQAQVAKDEKHFELDDVIRTLNEKMIRRHPHVFGEANEKLATPAEVLKNWQKIKAAEAATETAAEAATETAAEAAAAGSDNAPQKAPRLAKELRGFPALLTALKIGHRSEEWKFDWDTAEQVEAKVTEEIAEVKEAIQNNDNEAIEEELGDLFFALAQWSRHLKVEPETALRKANLKFEKRFHAMLEISKLDQESFRNLSLIEKEELWGKAKKLIRNRK